jgi:hypothetical protein
MPNKKIQNLKIIKTNRAQESLSDDVKAMNLISAAKRKFTTRIFLAKLDLIFHVHSRENKKQQVEIGVHMLFPTKNSFVVFVSLALSFLHITRPKETQLKTSNPFTDVHKAKSKVKVCFFFGEGEKTQRKKFLSLSSR